MPLKLVPPRGKRNPNYQIRGTYLKVRLQRSTGTPEKSVAILALKKAKREIEDGVFSVNPKTFATAALSYLRAGGERRFITPLSEFFGTTPIAKIDQEMIDAAAAVLYPDAGMATRNRQVYTPVSAILKHAGIDNALKRPKGARGNIRIHWLPIDDLHRLFSAAWDCEPRFGALCVFLFYTGCRLSEALSLHWSGVDEAHKMAFIGRTKNGKPRPVYLPTTVLNVLSRLDPGSGKVFGYAKCGRIYKLLDQASKVSGVVIPDGIAFHIFRHSYAALMRRKAGLDTSGLVATGAWASPDAARIYEHVDFSEEAVKAELLDEWNAA